MAYTTKISLNRASKSRLNNAGVSKRNFSSRKWQGRTATKKKKLSFLKREKFRRVLFTGGAILLVILFVGLLFGLSYVQSITEDLPSPDKPFGKKSAASEIYDRNGQLLYRVFGDENRDPVKIDEVPDLLKWSFLAAEDIDFYSHPGFDVTAVLRCGFVYLREGSSTCGGSTITQQLIKQTALTDERKLERKLKEIILALQIERERSKDEILEMYLTVAPEGSNIYGITSASEVYFGKEIKDLNLAEMAILAAIPQNPTQLSPTKSANPEDSQKRVKERQMYVLAQMERYKDLINAKNKELTGKDEDILTQEMIDEAKNYELKYRKPIFNIKAPHFVFYVQKLLQQRDYNGGEPFALSDIETGGYKITTTLDYDMQKIAEEQVKKGVSDYGSRYGAENAALVSMNPKTGEVFTMVGSKDYFGEPTPEGCTLGVNCRFEPNVNITDTLQSYGSSMKPMVYYMAIMNGLVNAGSQIADVPIKIGNYTPKNYEGGFLGIRSTRFMLAQSRNIPAIYLVDQMGVDNFVKEMQSWGYSSFTNPAGYGPSVSVGGADVRLIEHAQAYTVLANEGKLTKHEVILKIEDRDGNLIYEYKPKSEEVADPRGVYIVNDMLNGRKGGPGDSWDGRDVAGKTGTSESQRETLFATYTPEIVVVGWIGNNDNTSMRGGASGFLTARPWIAEFLKRVGGSFPKTPFPRPSGIISAGSCSAEEGSTCEGIAGGDLGVAGIKVPAYVKVTTATVCKDQKNKLAREIDIQLGLSKTIQIRHYLMPNPKMQGFLDDWLGQNPKVGGVIPTEFCDINRNPGGTLSPWAVVSSPTSGEIITTSLNVNFNAFSANAGVKDVEILFDGTSLTTTSTLPYSNTFTVSPGPGIHTVQFKVTDTAGETGITEVTVEVLGTISITSPANGAIFANGSSQNVTFNYTGAELDSAELYVGGISIGTCSASSCSWTVSGSGPTTLQVKGSRGGQPIDSNTVNVVVTP